MKKAALIFFLVILSNSLFIYLFLSLSHRIPQSHDTWQYLTFQYHFLNGVAQGGGIPFWMPFMNLGTISNWSFIVQADFLQLIYFDFGQWWSHKNFLPWAYLGFFLDELFLLTGVWYLCRKWFDSIFVIFFVSCSVVLSTIWIDQVWYNFHSYFLIPLILYFFHEALDSGRVYKALLGSSLIVGGLLGNPPYFLPMISFTVVFYFFVYFLLFYDEFIKKIRNFQFKRTDGYAFFLLLFSVMSISILLNSGTEQIINHNIGRTLEGKVSLGGFLTYGGFTSLLKFLEVFFGISGNLDQTLYGGLLIIPMVFLALVTNLCRSCLLFFIICLAFVLLSIGSSGPVADALYYSIPGMQFYRHIGLVGPHVKLFLCFVAGFGFESILKKKITRIHIIICLVYYLGIIAAYFVQMHAPNLPLLAERYYLGTLGRVFDEPGSLNARCWSQIYFTVGFFLVFLFFLFKKNSIRMVVALLLIVNFIDLFVYRFDLYSRKTVQLSSKAYSVFEFQPWPFENRRIVDYRKNSRFQLLQDPLFKTIEFSNELPLHAGSMGNYGAISWWTENFLFLDTVYSPFRNDYWLKPLDDYMHVYWNWPNHATQPGFDDRKLFFPSYISPVKIPEKRNEEYFQLFSTAYVANDMPDVLRHSNLPFYKGNYIAVTPSLTEIPTPSGFGWPGVNQMEKNKEVDTRINAKIDIHHFDDQNVELSIVTLPTNKSWLFFKGRWNPFWKVTVNENEVPIYLAVHSSGNSGKFSKTQHEDWISRAIELEPIKSVVKFEPRVVINPSLEKLSGLTQDKIQVFTSVYGTSITQEIVDTIKQEKYTGDSIVLLTDSKHPLNDLILPIENLQKEPTLNSRTSSKIVVKNYNPNELNLHLEELPSKPSWLFFSSIWHPSWKVKVNGQERPIYQANLAYNAVQLDPNRSEVEFRFVDHKLSFAFFCMRIIGHIWIIILLFLTYDLFRKKHYAI